MMVPRGLPKGSESDCLDDLGLFRSIDVAIAEKEFLDRDACRDGEFATRYRPGDWFSWEGRRF